jgi:hypothetical protein
MNASSSEPAHSSSHRLVSTLLTGTPLEIQQQLSGTNSIDSANPQLSAAARIAYLRCFTLEGMEVAKTIAL